MEVVKERLEREFALELIACLLYTSMAPANVVDVARALEAEGADGLSIINSIQGMAIDVNTRRSRVAKPKGGLSGPLCHPIAVRMVWEVAQAVDLPINGCLLYTSRCV